MSLEDNYKDYLIELIDQYPEKDLTSKDSFNIIIEFIDDYFEKTMKPLEFKSNEYVYHLYLDTIEFIKNYKK